jgi:hypothetical protein
MAHLSVTILAIGRAAEHAEQDFVDVRFRIHFFPGEVRLDLTYYLALMITEKDDGLDEFMLRQTGFSPNFGTLLGGGPPDPIEIQRFRAGNADDILLFLRTSLNSFATWAIRPEGREDHVLERRVYIFGHQPGGPEEIVAYGWIIPEVSMHQGVSAPFRINL